MTTATAHYGWQMPDPGGSANTWGNTLNATTQAIDAQVFTNAQGAAPIGSVTMFAGATPPANWLLCQGQSLATTGTYAALFAVIGYAFGGSGANFNLPNLQSKFPLGATPPGSPVGQVGGAFSYTIAVGNLPSHAHPITDVAHNHGVNQSPHNHGDPGHVHSVSDPGHAHTAAIEVLGSGVNIQPGSGFNMLGQGINTSSNGTGVSVNGAATNLQAANANISLNASGTGLSTTQAVGSGAAMSIVPFYVALNYIIRFQ